MPDEVQAQDPLADPMVMVVMGVGAVAIIAWVIMKKKGMPSFKAQTLEKIYRKDLNKILILLGEKKSRNFLRQGYHKIGKILRMCDVKMSIQSKKNPRAKKVSVITGDFYLFRTRTPNIIGKIKAVFGIYDIFLVDQKFIEQKESEDYHIGEQVQVQILEGIGIFSGIGSLVLEGLAWKHAYNQTLQSAVNQASRVVYLEVAHSKFVSKAEKIAGIESKRYSQYLEGIGEK
jgi:hypothetical protein